MPVINFSDWTPDDADLGSSGAVVVKNALPGRTGYKPFSSLSVITDAVLSRPLGAIEAFDIDDDSYQYVGIASKIYELDNNLSWTDVTNSGGAYTTAAGEAWEFVRWENKVLGVNFTDNPQQITMGGANFTDLSTDYRARHIAVVRDFVVVGNTYDSSDGNRPNRVRWSGIGDETTWTVSASTLADFRDLPTGGPIQKILGGEVGIIVSQRGVSRMTFIGAPVVFQIDEVLPEIGAICPGCVTQLGDNVYFISEQGFVELVGGGTGVNYIGAGKVDQFFFGDIDPEFLSRMSCVADPTGNRIIWAYPGADSIGGRPNKLIIYDRTFLKWSLIEEEVELLLRSKGIPLTLDELDSIGYTNIDTMDVSLDSAMFKQSASQLSAFDEEFKLGFFRGLYKTATIETSESEIFPGNNAQVNAFRPLVDLGTVTAQVGRRDRLSDPVTWGASLSQSASGKFNVRSNARYHRFRLTISGSDWVDALGVQIDPQDVRRGAGRA
jgi:hypothetical protein